jgi:hypothetical protein
VEEQEAMRAEPLSLPVAALLSELFQDVPCEELVDLTVPWHWLRSTRFGIVVPVVISTVPNEFAARFFELADQIRTDSSEGQFSNTPDARNLATGYVAVQISKVVLKLCQRLALSQVVGEFLKVAEPHLAILPVDVTSRVHSTILTAC